MGRQTNIKIIGTQGNIIYYKWKDVYSIRSKPAFVKQTKATKASASVFGVAAGLGAALRKTFMPLLPDAKDRKMQLSFQTELQYFLQQYRAGNIPAGAVTTALHGFRFNEKAGSYGALQQLVSIKFILGNIAEAELKTLHFKQKLSAPKNTTTITLLVAAASFNAMTGKITDQHFLHQEILYADETIDAKQFTIPLQTAGNNCAIVAAALQFNAIKNGIVETEKKSRWLPAMVMGVWSVE